MSQTMGPAANVCTLLLRPLSELRKHRTVLCCAALPEGGKPGADGRTQGPVPQSEACSTAVQFVEMFSRLPTASTTHTTDDVSSFERNRRQLPCELHKL